MNSDSRIKNIEQAKLLIKAQQLEKLEKEKAETINIKIERNGDFYYVFESDTDSFMGQATTRIDLEKVLAEKFPGKRFYATAANLKEVGFK